MSAEEREKFIEG